MAGHTSMVSFLLQNGANAVGKDGIGRQPIHEACKADTTKVVSLLLDCGASVNSPGACGYTPLYYVSCETNNPDLTQLLLHYGAGIEAETVARQRPLELALVSSHDRVAKVLILAGANPNYTRQLPSIVGVTFSPLGLAIENRMKETAVQLLEHGAKVNASSPSGATILHCMALLSNEFSYRLEYVELLVEYGLDLRARDNQGNEPLHFIVQSACSVDFAKLLDFFLRHGAVLNARNNYGETPLYIAAKQAKPEIMRLLMQRGATRLSYEEKMGLVTFFNKHQPSFTHVEWKSDVMRCLVLADGHNSAKSFVSPLDGTY